MSKNLWCRFLIASTLTGLAVGLEPPAIAAEVNPAAPAADSVPESEEPQDGPEVSLSSSAADLRWADVQEPVPQPDRLPLNSATLSTSPVTTSIATPMGADLNGETASLPILSAEGSARQRNHLPGDDQDAEPVTIPQASIESAPSVLDELSQYTDRPTTGSDPMAQVTSVTQFSDVQPTDWAYQALQSLVERYGCIVGYPDGTFKGQRALSRYEFAAGMNACLDRISELLAASTADLATREDLATLQRLQEEFAAELATLRGRVDELDSRTAQLEANQFSTTTKLSGETIFAVADLFGGGAEEIDDSSLDESNNTIFGSRVRLAFDTSFSGSDRLRARLQVGNFERFNTTDRLGNTVIGNEARLGFDTGTDNDFEINNLSYLFPIGDQITAMVAAQASHFLYFDFIDPVTPFSSSGRGAISRFGRFNPIYRVGTGTGAGVSFDFDVASLQLAYLAGDAGSPSPGSGLFNGDYGALAQLTLKPFDALTLAFTYANSYSGTQENDDGTRSAIGLNTGTGSNRSRVRVGDAPVVVNSYGVEVNFRVAKFLQIGGWATFSAVRAIETGDADVWTYAGTISFPDLGKKGNLLGFVIGVQPYLGGTTGFTVSDRRSDDNGLHIEGFYRLQLNDYISVTPGFVVLTAPDQDLDNETAVLGVVRTTFTF